jgi:hypothetical protein
MIGRWLSQEEAKRLLAKFGEDENCRNCFLLALVRVGHVLIKRCAKEQKQDGKELRRRITMGSHRGNVAVARTSHHQVG